MKEYFDLSKIIKTELDEVGLHITSSGPFLYGLKNKDKRDETEAFVNLSNLTDDTRNELKGYGFTPELLEEMTENPYRFINKNNLTYKGKIGIGNTGTTAYLECTPEGAILRSTKGTIDISPYLEDMNTETLYGLIEQVTPYKTNELVGLMGKDIEDITKSISNTMDVYSTPYAEMEMDTTGSSESVYESIYNTSEFGTTEQI